MNRFDERKTTSFGLSIGTGLALESLFEPTTERYDVDREIPNKVSIDKYKLHIFNIFTLARNILNAVADKDKDALLNDKHFMDVLKDEIYLIDALYEDSKCRPVIFIPDYSKVYKNMNNGKETGITKAYIENEKILSKLKNFRLDKDIHVFKGNYKLPSAEGRILITTSIPIDLLNKGLNLELLESHTGKLKTKKDFYTKFHKLGKNSLEHIPFLQETLYYMGDGSIVLPQPLKIRRMFYELSVDRNWTSRTTSMKIRDDISKIPELKEVNKNFKSIF